MSTSNSTKVPADFPLWWHKSNRQWCKKFKQKLFYFGPRDATWEEALRCYNTEWPQILEGKAPKQSSAEVTLKELCNAFIESRKQRLEVGELTAIMLKSYRETCTIILREFGGARAVKNIAPSDFTKLRAAIARQQPSPNTQSSTIQRVRTLFKWGWDSETLPAPVKFGLEFKRPGKRTVRIHKASKRSRLLSVEQMRLLIEEADPRIRARILMGINCGMGAADIISLPDSAIDREKGWIDFVRPKTGVRRRCKLWPETLEAMKAVNYKKAKIQSVGESYERTAKRLGFKSTFYDLRHTYRTWADEGKDQPAALLTMGHEDPSISSVYREAISDSRLEAIAAVVHDKLWPREGGAS